MGHLFCRALRCLPLVTVRRFMELLLLIVCAEATVWQKLGTICKQPFLAFRKVPGI